MSERISWYDSGYKTHYTRDYYLDQNPQSDDAKTMVYDKFMLLWNMHIKADPKFMEDYFEKAALAFFVEGWCDSTGLYVKEKKEQEERAAAEARKLALEKRWSMKLPFDHLHRCKTFIVDEYYISVLPWNVPVLTDDFRYPIELGEAVYKTTTIQEKYYSNWIHRAKVNSEYTPNLSFSGPYDTQAEAIKAALDHMVEASIIGQSVADESYTRL